MDTLVALGTLGVTAVAVLELKTLRRERAERRVRELCDRAYLPLRRAYRQVVDLEILDGLHRADDFERTGSRVWNRLSTEAPYLTRLMPRDLVALLDETNSSLRRLELEHHKTAMVAAQARDRSGTTRILGDPERRDPTLVRLWADGCLVSDVNPFAVWLSGLHLDEWARAESARLLPGPVERVDFEVFVGDVKKGGTEEARAIHADIEKALDADPGAASIRDLSTRLRRNATQIVARIDAELARSLSFVS